MYKTIIIILFVSINLYAHEKYFLETPVGGDFSLETSLSKKFKLSDLKGKTVFIFFGFKACPNICPFTVQRLKELQNDLMNPSPQQATGYRGVRLALNFIATPFVVSEAFYSQNLSLGF